jgi:transcriptional regulator with AAA-type ATPase domain
MIGDSPAMQALLNNITLVAPSDATVLITASREPVKNWWRAPSTPAASA